jgi:hypothetical protein
VSDPRFIGLPLGKPERERVPPSGLPRGVPAGVPLTRDQQVAAELAAAAVALDEASGRNGLDLEALKAARAAYGKAGALEEYRSQDVQRRKAKERAVARLHDVSDHGDGAMFALLADALRLMARHVCSRGDHHEAAELEYAREVARVLLKVLVDEHNQPKPAA